MALIFPCQVCQTQLQADESQVGQLVRCPTCLTALKVPVPQRVASVQSQGAPAMAGAGVGAGVGAGAAGSGQGMPGTFRDPRSPPRTGPAAFGGGVSRGIAGKRYGFNCGYCSSRLEANESMAAQEGQCPTCGKSIVIPILDRYGRLIDPHSGKIIKQDPHPVHAYAAAGDRAPKIIRQSSGQNIQCPRCSSMSPITANNCKSCGMPFTMEGTTLEAAGQSNGWCVASLVLGIIGTPAGCTVVAPLLAIIFGIVGLNAVSKSGGEGGGKGMAIAGIICGVIGCIVGAMMIFN